MKKTTIRIIIWQNEINVGPIDNIWEFEIEHTKDGKFPSHIQSCFNDAISQLEFGRKVSIELVE